YLSVAVLRNRLNERCGSCHLPERRLPYFLLATSVGFWPAAAINRAEADTESAPARNLPRIPTPGRLPMDVLKYLDNQLGRGAALSRRLQRQSALSRRRPRPSFAVLEER